MSLVEALSIASLALLSGTGQIPPGADMAVAGEVFFVKNNSGVSVKCQTRLALQNWSSWVKLDPGEEWRSFADADERFFHCEAPVKQTVYKLLPGERYSLLRNRAGEQVTLWRITPDEE